MTVFKELKRRNVFKVATAYLITTWLIIQIVTVLEPHLKLPEWVSPVIIVFLVVGFPIACLFAWAFELTPAGIMRSKDVVVDNSIVNITGRKLDFGIITAMAIAVVFLTYEAYFAKDLIIEPVKEGNSQQTQHREQTLTKPVEEQITSIAVLPFVNMSNDPDQEYFSDGLSEELLNVLARIKQLKVAARTSSFFFKNKNMDIKEIAEKLNVAHVLEGSVRKSGTKLRVTAQLIQADNGYHLWSETYNYEAEDIFKIQDEISAAVVKQLKITLLNEQVVALTEHGTRIPEAQDAYLLGRYYMRDRTSDSLANAVTAFRKSLTIDANNQLAISGLLDTYLLQSSYANLTVKNYLALAKPLLSKYLDKDNNSAEMNTSIGAYYNAQENIERATQFYERAIATNVNYVQAYHWLANMRRTFDHQNIEGIREHFHKALQLDPYSEILLISLFGWNYDNGKIIEAENYMQRLNEVSPNASLSNAYILAYYWQTGRNWQKAWQILINEKINKSQFNHDENFYFYLALGKITAAEQEIKKIQFKESYGFAVVFMNYHLGLYRLNKGIINEAEFIDFMSKSFKTHPHKDNVFLQALLAIRANNYQLAKTILEKDYHHILTAKSINYQELIFTAAFSNVLKQLNDPRHKELAKMAQQKIKSLLPISSAPEAFGTFPALIFSLTGDNESALKELTTLYAENNYYHRMPLIQKSVAFDPLRKNVKFQQLLKLAEQKLQDKVTEFDAVLTEAEFAGQTTQ